MQRKLMNWVLVTSVMLLLTACDKDKDSTATISYKALCEVTFTDEEAGKEFAAYVEEALDQKLGLAGAGSIFTTTYTALSMDEVMYNCNKQAVSQYEAKLKTLSLDAIKKAIFDLHPLDMTEKGYATATDIPLKDFKVVLNLYNAMYVSLLNSYTYTY